MTQEEKDKLFKYLSMALPYGLKVHWEGCDYGDKTKNLVTIDEFRTINDEFQVEDCKPYLRPLDSMTEGELKELNLFVGDYAYVYYNSCVKDLDFRLNSIETIPNLYFDIFINIQNWLLAHHFDFMGLIPIDCAIEVTQENNPYKE